MYDILLHVRNRKKGVREEKCGAQALLYMAERYIT